jgi:hypothetical protein
MDQYNEYHLKKKIAEILLNNGAHIFGGYVRDKLLHDSHAQKFYKKYGYNGDELENRAKYIDSKFATEFNGRSICPNDIDCYMTQMNLDSALVDLHLAKLDTFKVFDHEPKKYISNLNIPFDSMRHKRYKITGFSFTHILKLRRSFESIVHVNVRSLIENEFDSFLNDIGKKLLPEGVTKFAPIYIDVFVPLNDADFSKYEAPFANLDFECNGLIYTKHGIHISRSVSDFKYDDNDINEHLYRLAVSSPLDYCQKLLKITQDIEKRIATVVNKDVHVNRLRKMINKGWTISGNRFTLVERNYNNIFINETDEDDDTCLICHETFTAKKPAYKLPCCEAQYHLRCMLSACREGPAAMERTEKCLMCRQDTPISQDVSFIERVINENIAYDIRVEQEQIRIRRDSFRPIRRYQPPNFLVPLPIPIPIPPLIQLVRGNVDDVD